MTEPLYTTVPPLRPCVCGHDEHYQINGRCLTGCGCTGRAVDKTGASEAEFRVRIAPFEGDDRVETVARAMCAVDAFNDSTAWDESDWLRNAYRAMAAAAIAALPPSPAEEAVRALLRDIADGRHPGTGAELAAFVVRRLGAALASPAPAPHDGCTCDNVVPRKGSGRWG